jgi:hypothetical protein
VSRNDALGILLGGTVQATGAVIDGNAVVLAAGGDIVGGQVRALAAGIVPAGTATGIAIDKGEFPHLVQNGNFTASASGDLALRRGVDIQATGKVSLAAGRALELGQDSRVRALGDIGMVAGGAITIGANGLVQSGAATSISAGGNLGLGADSIVRAAGDVAMGAGQDLSIGDNATIAAGKTVRIAAGRELAIGADPDVTATGIVSLAASQGIAIGTRANIISGGDGKLAAGGTIAVASGATRTSSAALDMNAGGAITFASASRAAAAGAMALLAGGSIGLAQTAELVGGIGLTASAGQNDTIAGSVRLSEPAAGSTVAIQAGNTIDVVTPTGSIVLRGANGGLFGRLSLSAPRIVIADATTRQTLAVATSPKERLAALLGDGSRIALDGFVAADTVSLTGSQTIFVQNTGNDGNFAGVNANALTVAATSGSFPEVHVFGRSTGTGGIVVANNRLREFIIDRAYPFVAGSSVNNCLLSVASCNPIRPPSNDVVFDGPINSIPLPAQAPFALEVELAMVGDLDPRELGLLDDPVTGSGDITQWQDTCIEKDGRKCP